MARAPSFDLARALASPSFTPGQRDAPALVELVVDGDEATSARARAALTRLADTGRRAIEGRLEGATPPRDAGPGAPALDEGAAARLVTALGELARAGDAAARAGLLARAGDPRVRVRRAAIVALGKLGGDDARAAVLARWDADDVTPDERRALAEALGKLGGREAIDRLQRLAPGPDKELERRQARALLMAERDAARATLSSVRIDVAPAGAFDLVLRCKPGLAPLLAEELAARGLSGAARGDAEIVLRQFRQPWSALHASRLWLGAALELPFAAGEGDLEATLVQTLGAPAIARTLAALTDGPVRYRIGFSSGHRRGLVWRLARQLPYANDPTQTTWDMLVDEPRRVVSISPRRAADPRFAWRVAEVPASSHPTVAAAIAYLGGAAPGDRVWDPFVGAGAELIERATLGPVASLEGSDLDDQALDAARRNLAAAGLTARLARGDARSHPAGDVELIVTNPPLGSRVHVDAAGLLVAALPHLASRLVPGGRLSWITPATRTTSPAAERAGLRRTRALAIDLGGVRGTLERWERPRR